ncbi:hypothetical protein BDAP_002599 [Binucleata daphniae]
MSKANDKLNNDIVFSNKNEELICKSDILNTNNVENNAKYDICKNKQTFTETNNSNNISKKNITNSNMRNMCDIKYINGDKIIKYIIKKSDRIENAVNKYYKKCFNENKSVEKLNKHEDINIAHSGNVCVENTNIKKRKVDNKKVNKNADMCAKKEKDTSKITSSEILHKETDDKKIDKLEMLKQDFYNNLDEMADEETLDEHNTNDNKQILNKIEQNTGERYTINNEICDSTNKNENLHIYDFGDDYNTYENIYKSETKKETKNEKNAIDLYMDALNTYDFLDARLSNKNDERSVKRQKINETTKKLDDKECYRVQKHNNIGFVPNIAITEKKNKYTYKDTNVSYNQNENTNDNKQNIINTILQEEFNYIIPSYRNTKSSNVENKYMPLSDKSHAKNYKTQLCRYFMSKTCTKDDKCNFSHDLSRFPCKAYHLRNNCTRAKCPFSHEQLKDDELARLKEGEENLEEKKYEFKSTLQFN